ncbi:MAG: DUF3592 domain-containing protein [Deltaproteobacteria bacterium]|nr:DUF3592 domain-containing protein [Deltaproteobacteria bacterium]
MKLAFLATIILAVVGLLTSILASLQVASQLWLSIIPAIIFALASLFGLIFLVGAGLGLGTNRRKRRIYIDQRFLVTVFLILFTSIVGIFNIYTIFQVRDYDYLQKNGVVTQAEVIANHKEWKGKGGHSYSIMYRFDVTDTKGRSGTLTHTQGIGKALYEQLKTGSFVTILYDPTNPAFSVVADNGIYSGEGTSFLGEFNAFYFLIIFPLFILHTIMPISNWVPGKE